MIRCRQFILSIAADLFLWPSCIQSTVFLQGRFPSLFSLSSPRSIPTWKGTAFFFDNADKIKTACELYNNAFIFNWWGTLELWLNCQIKLTWQKRKYSVGGRGLTDGIEEKVNDRALKEEVKWILSIIINMYKNITI